MALSLATVGGKITAAFINAIIGLVNRQGLTAIIPTSVAGTGVVVNAAGQVTFTASSAVNVNGCFTSTFDNYLIVINSPTASVANSLNFRLRLAGADDSTANYDSQSTNSAGATVSAFQNLAGTSFGIDGVVATIKDAELFLISPAVAQPTRGESRFKSTANPATAVATAKKEMLLLHRSSTAFDGFSLIVSAGTITGNLRIYGYNNNV